MAEIRIVDAQVHIWAAPSTERPWLPPGPGVPTPHRAVPFTKDDLLREMDAAGVDRALLVPPMWEGDRNDLVLEAARLYPERFAAIGRFDPETPGSRSAVGAWRRQPGMLGMRFTFHRPHLRRLLAESVLEWLWSEAERAQVAIMLLVRHADMHFVDRIAERHPGLKLAIDHLGLTEGKDAAAFAGLDRVLALAHCPNVAVKVSCLPHFTSDTYPYRSLHPYLRRVYDAFGPRRMFWGTDLSRLPCSCREAITMFTEEIPWLTATDKEWIMGRGVCEWVDWKLT